MQLKLMKEPLYEHKILQHHYYYNITNQHFLLYAKHNHFHMKVKYVNSFQNGELVAKHRFLILYIMFYYYTIQVDLVPYMYITYTRIFTLYCIEVYCICISSRVYTYSILIVNFLYITHTSHISWLILLEDSN